jgi:hypothetical protein
MHIGATTERLRDLQRAVNTLQGCVQDMQWELRQSHRHSLAQRWWRNLLGARQGGAFMSACCNRRVRPNTKTVDYAVTRNER